MQTDTSVGPCPASQQHCRFSGVGYPAERRRSVSTGAGEWRGNVANLAATSGTVRRERSTNVRLAKNVAIESSVGQKCHLRNWGRWPQAFPNARNTTFQRRARRDRREFFGFLLSGLCGLGVERRLFARSVAGCFTCGEAPDGRRRRATRPGRSANGGPRSASRRPTRRLGAGQSTPACSPSIARAAAAPPRRGRRSPRRNGRSSCRGNSRDARSRRATASAIAARGHSAPGMQRAADVRAKLVVERVEVPRLSACGAPDISASLQNSWPPSATRRSMRCRRRGRRRESPDPRSSRAWRRARRS